MFPVVLNPNLTLTLAKFRAKLHENNSASEIIDSKSLAITANITVSN